MRDGDTSDVNPGDDLQLRAAHDAVGLLSHLVQWLDFFMWFVIEYPDRPTVTYGWFVRKVRKDSDDWRQGTRATLTRPLIGFIESYEAGVPVQWVTAVMFEGGKRRSVSTKRFMNYIRSEIRALGREVFGLTREPPGWYPRRDLSPKGATLAAVHADYLDVRKKVLDYYAKTASKPGVNPPVAGFPGPVPLPASAPPPKTKASVRKPVKWNCPQGVSLALGQSVTWLRWPGDRAKLPIKSNSHARRLLEIFRFWRTAGSERIRTEIEEASGKKRQTPPSKIVRDVNRKLASVLRKYEPTRDIPQDVIVGKGGTYMCRIAVKDAAEIQDWE